MAFHRQVTAGRSNHVGIAVYHVLEVNYIESSSKLTSAHATQHCHSTKLQILTLQIA